jgi:hypothetical protein
MRGFCFGDDGLEVAVAAVREHAGLFGCAQTYKAINSVG